MKEPIWLDRMDCVAVHEMMLAQHGGLAGVRDIGLLESALAKPRNLPAHGKPTLWRMAASYAAGIIINHPFLDGNKHTGFMVAAMFLALNGLAFTAPEESAVTNTLALASGKMSETSYARWLKENSKLL